MLKPLIKYTGGKYREYEKIKQYFPKNFNNYYEPFFFFGLIFFRLHNENLLNGEKHVNDFSNSLMEFYQSVSSVTNKKELIKISDAWDFIREFGEDFFQLYGDKFSNLMLDDKLSNFINLDVKEYIEKRMSECDFNFHGFSLTDKIIKSLENKLSRFRKKNIQIIFNKTKYFTKKC